MLRKLLTPKWIAIGLGSMLALAGVVYGVHYGEQFLIRDPRFALRVPGDDLSGGAVAPEDDPLEISGAAHVSPRAIEAVFSDDFGKSAYLVPLSDRRATLRTVAWVKDASVARFWPNRVLVGVTERKPVAYLAVDSSRRPPFDRPMIDEEGVVLPPVEDRFTLPVLAGVRVGDSAAVRRERVQKLLRLMKELGDAGHAIVQVDLSDTDNIRVNEPFDGRMVTLLLGDRDFALRHQNFVRYFAEIRKKMAGATVLDLRVEDRITVLPPSGIPSAEVEASVQAVTD